MRRSAAPSQLASANKRPRFNPPITSGSLAGPDTSRTTRDILNLIQINRTADCSSSNVNCHDSSKESCGIINDTDTNSLNETNNIPNGDDSSISAHLLSDENSGEDVSLQAAQTSQDVSPRKGSTPSATKTVLVPKGFKPVFKSFKTPVQSRNGTSFGKGVFSCPVVKQSLTPEGATDTKTAKHDDCSNVKYFNVMWCKLSKKKHKKWEGDAILVARGRTVSLLDTDSKEIGRGTGYKTSELDTLGEGHTLTIGGKEIEVMSVLSEIDFKSGKCFTGGSTVAMANKSVQCVKTMQSGVSKPFSRPTKPGQPLAVQAATVAKPRHDPEAPEALVMPQPGPSHQWEHNKGQAALIDVVVDPYISQHLRPHQRAGVVFLYECIMGMKNFSGHGAILADEMGLGKTIQCIALIWTLLKQGPYGGKSLLRKVLVITPGSLVKNWLREFKKWLGTERLKVFAVGQDNKVTDYIDSPMYPVLIVSYEMFMRTIDIVRTVNFDLIICDEGHRLKNTNIKTTSLVSSLPCRRRIILTGTPVQNDLQELYSIVEFCNPGILGTAVAFRHVYEDAILASRRPGADTEEVALGDTRATELNRITGLFILRRTSDINNKYLPPKVDLVLFCQPSTLQLLLYKKLLASRAVKSCLYSRDMAQHLMCISALRKLCNHPSLLHSKAAHTAEQHRVRAAGGEDNNETDLYQDLYSVYPPDYDQNLSSAHHSGKLAVLSKLLSAFYEAKPRQRVVLVSNYTQTLDTLEALCKLCDYQLLRLDGRTPTGKRLQLVERFNSQYSKDFVFLLSSKAGGVGLNLVGASRLILYDIDWNPANDLQAMARVWRDGQRHTTYIYRLLTTGTIEEKMYQRQVTKQALSGVVVDSKGSSNNQVQFSQEELRDLFVLRDDTQSATHDILDCQCLIEGGSDDNNPTDTSIEPPRGCQLGKAPGSKKNLCMDELFQWKHIQGPAPCLTLDPILSETVLEDVTFVFCCQSNATEFQVSGQML